MGESEKKEREKWDFSDYAFTVTAVIVGVLLLGPQLLETLFGIGTDGQYIGDAAADFAERIEAGQGVNIRDFNEMRMLSPLLFMVTASIVFIKDAVDARRGNVYIGKLFTYDFESLLEDAIYMAISTAMVLYSAISGSMYISWLAGPITWLLYVFVMPLLKKRDDSQPRAALPGFLLAVFAAGVILEAITQQWIAFPLVWVIICAFKAIGTIRHSERTLNDIYDILYYISSVILILVGMILDFWVTSWLALPVAAFICWIIQMFKNRKDKKQGIKP
ncbi:MAG: hypothetical protein FWB75_06610 [Oscillospiraceae bacterium]|nr:hypothetical protein [Oscillospiraceae bacterium]